MNVAPNNPQKTSIDTIGALADQSNIYWEFPVAVGDDCDDIDDKVGSLPKFYIFLLFRIIQVLHFISKPQDLVTAT